MLEGLDNVNWLRHAGGYALKDKVPVFIRKLASDDDTVREGAFETIFEEMNHQDTIYDATPYIIPFLIELLTYDQIKDKKDLILGIWSVFQCCEEAFLYSRKMTDRATRNAILTYQHIAAGFYTFIKLLNHEELKARMAAMLLVSSLHEHAPASRHHLRRVYCSESDVLMRALTLKRLGDLVPKGYGSMIDHHRQKYLALFEPIIQSDPEPIVRLGAAMGWANAHPYSPYNNRLIAPQYIREALLTGLKYAPASVDIGWPTRPQFNTHEIIKVLTGLGWKDVIETFNFPLLDRYQAHHLVRNLLDVVFNRKLTREEASRNGSTGWDLWESEETRLRKLPETMIYAITDHYPRSFNPAKPKLNQPHQKEIIAAIVACDVFWELPTNLFSFFYGLPDSRDKLVRLVEAK